MKEFYLKGMDAVTIMLRKQGMSQEEVDKIDLSNVKDEDIQAMVREKLLGAMANNGHKQKVISTTRGGAVPGTRMGVCCIPPR